jgi:hypothetical protein
MMQPNSQSFQVVADLLRHIESLNISTDQYGILDGGETLELSRVLHTRLKDTSEFQAFENIGGNWYCFDDNEWEVA